MDQTFDGLTLTGRAWESRRMEVLEEQVLVTRIVLSNEEWECFMAELKRPPKVNPALRKLLTEPSVFEKASPDVE